MATSGDVVNRALELIGGRAQVNGVYPNFDTSTAGVAAGVLYLPTVNLLLRQMDPDFARIRAGLAVAAPIGLPDPWPYAYLYPATCLRMRQIAPQPGSYDKNDPQPIRGEIAFDQLAGKVILTTQASAVAVFTTTLAGAGNEPVWDSGFIETVARKLANPFAMAIAGRPDFARELLDEAEAYASRAELSEEL